MANSNFTPSKYQLALFDAIKNSNSNIVLEAVAGSGKTTSLLQALNYIPSNKKVQFLAFNKAIVEKLKLECRRPNTWIRTLHSAGFSVMMKTYGSKLDNYKYRRFLNDSIYLLSSQITIDTPQEDTNQYKTRVCKLIDLCRVELADTLEKIQEVALFHGVDLEYDEAEVCLKLMNWGKEPNQCKLIDYTDMIWLPVVRDLKTDVFDVNMIDESQDLGNCQRTLALRMVNPNGGRFIAVGDARQAINIFAGSNSESLNLFKEFPNTISLPLSICYRCSKAIIEKAKEIVPQIEASPNAIEGEVVDVDSLAGLKKGDMVLCRVNASLVSVAMKYIAAGIGCYVKGKDIGKSLITLVRKTKTSDLTQMFNILGNELYKMQVTISKKEKITMEEAKSDTRFINLEDKVNCIEAISVGCRDTKELIDEIDKLFQDDEENSICFSSIHKSKGLEVTSKENSCWIIDLDKLPLKRVLRSGNQAYIQAEYNLMYVAYTRGKSSLKFVTTNPDKLVPILD